ncbi:MAG: PIG-L family deacetylase [Planctomycetes bacterium]|nr:PIG-L family deacetylase [Planctomycetota bacterium]
MKIVHLVQNFPPEFQGGTEVYLLALCRLQGRAGHEVTVICGSEILAWKDRLVEENHAGQRVLRFFRAPRGEAYSADYYLERFEGLFLDFLHAEKPDLMHLHHWLNLGNELLNTAAWAGVPSVMTLHDLYPLCPRFFMTKPKGGPCGPDPVSIEDCLACGLPDYAGTYKRLEGEFRIRRQSMQEEFAAASRIIVPSRSHGEPYLRSGLLTPGRMTVLHHGLVREVPEPVWKPNVDKPLRLVTWGNLVKAKGIHTLVDAFRRVSREREGRFELHIFGRILVEEYESSLREAAAGLPVRFHGDFSRMTLAEMGVGKDLAIFPSLARESYSMVLDEAMALGLPVVVSDAGALPERVGEGGRIFPAGDADALAEVLLELEAERGALETMARTVRKLTWTLADSHRQLEDIYKKVREKGPSPVPRRAMLRRTAFLKGEIHQLDAKQACLEGAHLHFSRFREFVPLRDFSTLPGGNVVVLSPHPDDETIGCGGAMALHAQRGDRVTVVHLTDGSGGGDFKDLARIRKEEVGKACDVLGVERFLSLDFKDGHLLPDQDTATKVLEILRSIKPRVVYAPSAFEIHLDHIATLFLALHCLEQTTDPFTLLLYEVNEVMVPGFLIDITSVAEKKDRALACFESQISLNDVRTKAMAGSKWRTANVDLLSVTHAEAFIETEAYHLRGLIARCRGLVRFIGKKQG